MTSMTTRITVNGQTYSGVEQMPPDVRREYELAMGMLADKDGNGVPDVLEGKELPATAENGSRLKPHIVAKFTTSRLLVNGKKYQSWEQVPDAIRNALPQVRAAPGARSEIDTRIISTSGANFPDRQLGSDEGIRISLPWLILLLLAAVVGGILIAMKFMR
jgi:hypothetical protein